MVIPVGIKEELERSLRVVAKDNGFGLWKIETSNKEPEGVCVPKDFLKHMEDEFRNPPEPPEKMEHFEPSITDKAPRQDKNLPPPPLLISLDLDQCLAPSPAAP